MAKSMKWTWGAVITALLGTLSFFGGLPLWELWTRYQNEKSESAYEMQIKDFDKLSLITQAELTEDGVSFTYYSCGHPDLVYTLHYFVNGRLMKTEGPHDPKDHKVLDRCFTYTGDIHTDLNVKSGDDVVIRYHFGDHGVADLEIIVR